MNSLKSNTIYVAMYILQQAISPYMELLITINIYDCDGRLESGKLNLYKTFAYWHSYHCNVRLLASY